MRAFGFRLACAVLAAFAPGLASVAYAQNLRSFVSGKGVDTNPCTLTAPCRTVAQTNAGGEVAALDTAGYGAVTITKSISIVNQDGVEAGIAVTSAGNAVTIQAAASDVVNLRGLTITGGDVGTNGIVFQSGGALAVHNTTVRNFAQDGIVVKSAAATVILADVIVSDIVNDGINFSPTASATLTVQKAQVFRCKNIGILLGGSGAAVGAAVVGTVVDSLMTLNGRGMFLDGFSNSAQPVAHIIGANIVSNTSIGIVVSGSKAFLAHSTLAGNKSYGYLMQFSGSVLNSFGNNNIVDTTNQGSLTPISQR